MKKGVDDAIAAATGITLSQATQDKIGSTKWTAGTLAEVTEIAQAVRGEYAARFNVSAEADAAKTAVAAIDEAVKDAQEALDKAVADSNNTTLSADGWKVFRFWETDIRKHPGRCIGAVLRYLAGFTSESAPQYIPADYTLDTPSAPIAAETGEEYGDG